MGALLAAPVLVLSTIPIGAAESRAVLGAAVPPIATIDDYLLVGTKPFTADNAIDISQNELGADRSVITSDNQFASATMAPFIIEAQDTNVFPPICYEAGSPIEGCEANPQDGLSSKASRALIPDFDSVFQSDPSAPTNPLVNRWFPGEPLAGFDNASVAPTTNPSLANSPGIDYLPYAGTGVCPSGDREARTFRGVDWSGNIAVTSPTGIFSLSNVNLFANYGVRSTTAIAGDNISGSYYYPEGALTGVQMDSMDIGSGSGAEGPNPAKGWTGPYDHSGLVTDLRAWRTYLRSLTAESTFEEHVQNRSTTNGSTVRVDCYSDTLDTNGDGIILVDILSPDVNNFFVSNSDWVIDGTGNKLIVFRLRNGRNMQVDNSSIMIGEGLAEGGTNYSKIGVIFAHVHPDEEFTSESGSSDTVFTIGQSIMNGVAWWDLNTIDDAAGDTDYGDFVDRTLQGNYTSISHNNTQGCGQFIAPRVNMQNVRWVHCVLGAPAATYDLSLVNTTSTTSVAANGDDISWTVRVHNQGTANSGPFTVTDELPTGTSFNVGSATYTVGGTGQTAIGTPIPSVASGRAGFSFTNADGLIPGGYIDITFTTNVDDITGAPFRNWAEVSADSGDDEDSTPDTATGSDQTPPTDPYTSIVSLADASLDNFDATDEDDNDDAEVGGPYDLGLVNVTTTPTVAATGDDITWTIRVANQATIDSGPFTVTDTLPTGTSYNAASATYAVGGIGQPAIGAPVPNVTAGVMTISFTDTAGLIPGGYIDITFTTNVDDVAQAPFRNWAEISADGGADLDSTPDAATGANATPPTDPYVGITALTDPNTTVGDEDDNDDASVTAGTPTYDLAARETIVGVNRDDVDVLIEVFNQGAGTVHEIDLRQVLDPTVFGPFSPTDNPAGTAGAPIDPAYTAPATLPSYSWDATDPTAPLLLIVGGLQTGESVTIPARFAHTPADPPSTDPIAPIEIVEFRDAADTALTDEDSTPDLDTTNDAGGEAGSPSDGAIDGDGTGTPGSTDPATDEDDEDPIRVRLFDLALTVVPSPTQPAPLATPNSPDLVSFDVAVTNQGPNATFATEINVTPPTGATFQSVVGASGSSPRFEIAELQPGQAATFTVVYELADTAAGAYPLVAEIVSFDDDNDPGNTTPIDVADIDSTPDTNPANDAGGLLGSPSDGIIDGDGTGLPGATDPVTDEDDADPAVITLAYDLAATVRVDPADPQLANGVSSGEEITFFVEVFNQGRDVAAIDVTQYVPVGSGLAFDPADNADGTTVAGSYDPPTTLPVFTWDAADPTRPVVSLSGGLGGGESVRVPVVLTVATPPAGEIFTEVEILDVRNAADVTVSDSDSVPNDNSDDDLQVDDVIDSNPLAATDPDEDDQDVAFIRWWDLSLITTSADYVLDASVPTPQATFTVSVKNQGPSTAYDVVIRDGAPVGGSISSVTEAFAGGCTHDGTNAQCSVDEIAAGATVTFDLVVAIDDLTQGTYENRAEIASLDGLVGVGAGAVQQPVSDIDSVPDLDLTNDVLFEDVDDPFGNPRNSHNDLDFVDGVGSVNEPNVLDEDDHDVQVVTFPLAVGDYVWFDLDADGVQDATEQPVEGATVKLLTDDGSGTLTDATDADGTNVNVVPTLTDADGWYLFDNLLPGTYVVEFAHNEAPFRWTQPDATTDDSDSDAIAVDEAIARTAPFALATDEPTMTAVGSTDTTDLGPINATHIDRTRDAGIWMPVAVGDVAWYDVDGDGAQDAVADEPGVAGVAVTLTRVDGTPALDAAGLPATTTTAADGRWTIDNLAPGDYEVVFSDLPAGWEVTDQNAGADTADSDADATGTTGSIVLSTDDAVGNMEPNTDAAIDAELIDPTVDIGLFRAMSLGDLVWLDGDRDGDYEPATETGIEGVGVTLTDTAGDPVNDADGVAVGSVLTDAGGRYSFDNLTPGDYRVEFSLADGHRWTVANDAADSLDSDVVAATDTEPVGVTAVITLDPLATAPTDADPAGLDVDDPTADAGMWIPFAIGDYVWFDIDHDGTQDAGEAPVVGALATLEMLDSVDAWVPALDANGAPANTDGIDETDANGLYLFDNLLAGTYRVVFEHGQTGWFWTALNSGLAADGTDSDAVAAADGAATATTGDIVLGTDGANVRAVSAVDTTTYGAAPAASFIDPTNDAGVWMPVAVGDYVWYDDDHDGLQDDAELPVEAVTVELLKADGTPAIDADGAVIAPVTTDPSGRYLFDRLLPGDYQVQFSEWPSGWNVTTPGTDPADEAVDSDPDATGLADAVTLTAAPSATMSANIDPTIDAGFIDPTVDMGIFRSVSLGDLVWHDADRDGMYEPSAGEDPLAGVTVELMMDDGTGTFVDAIDANGTNLNDIPEVTDDGGRYSFTNLVGGRYQVVFHLPDGYLWTRTGPGADRTLDSDAVFTDPDDATAATAAFDLGPTTSVGDGDPAGLTVSDPSRDAGVWFPFALGDVVWYDVDRDGRQDLDEDPVAGAEVSLLAGDGTGGFVPALDADGVTVPTQTTGTDGVYLFDNLLPGTYKVRFAHGQDGFRWTIVDSAGVVDGLDSDAVFTSDTDANAESAPIVVDVGETNTRAVTAADETTYAAVAGGSLAAEYIDPTTDAGIWMPLAVGDFAWYDTDHNGLQGTGPTPVEGVTVSLSDADGAPVADAYGTAVEPMLTGADGSYVFDGLLPGQYKVTFSNWPAGWAPTVQGATPTGDATDSDAGPTGMTDAFTLSVPAADGSLPDDMELNADATVDAHLIDPTVDLGIFQSVTLGDLVWFDADGDGLYEPATEDGLADVTVELMMADPSTPGSFIPATDADGVAVADQTTDSNGRYLFTNLNGGEYRVVFHLPDTYLWTDSLAAIDATLDSDAVALAVDSPTATSGVVTISGLATAADSDPDGLTANDSTIDAGVWLPLAIGDRVWFDLDRDGTQDATEQPVVGATATLEMLDGNNAWVSATDAHGAPVNGDGADETDANGLYLFDNLAVGTYRVVFEHGQAGWYWTAPNSGLAADTSDSDAVALTDGAATATTGEIVLGITEANVRAVTAADSTTYGAAPTASFIDPTNDAGIWMPVAVGDFVWYDDDHNGVQDDAELPVEGVTVALLDAAGDPAVDADGAVLAPTTTDSTGGYLFDRLLPGEYQVQFSDWPAGSSVTVAGTDPADDDVDSDPDATGRVESVMLTASATVTMSPNTDPDVEAGFIDPTVDMGLFRSVSLGDLVWHDADRDGVYEPNAGEQPLADVTVELMMDDGSGTFADAIDVDGDNVNAPPVTTDDDGRYSFTNLIAGRYQVVFHLPEGYLWTPEGRGTDLTLNSDAAFTDTDDATASTAPFVLGPTTSISDGDPAGLPLTDPSRDAGVWFPFALGDVVWFDLDRDGEQGVDEARVDGAEVSLLMDSGSGTFVAATHADGSLVATVTTGADGRYLFDNLLPGRYKARFEHGQDGYRWTEAGATGVADGVDSDATFTADTDAMAESAPVVLAVGETDTRAVTAADAAAYAGVLDGPLVAEYIDPTTDAGIWMPVAVGDFVWYDTDHNGLQGAGPAPVVGVTVALADADGAAVLDAYGDALASVTTDADGFYAFDGLLPGEYKVTFSNWPAGWAPTTQGTTPTGDASDSDAGPTGMTGAFTLSVPEADGSLVDDMELNTDAAIDAYLIDPTVDLGIFRSVTLGDLVWYDADRDGLYDPATEDGLADVAVELLMADPSTPGSFIAATDADGAPVADQATDATGRYLFTNLNGGDYQVVFHLPDGYRWTKPLAGLDPSLDSDATAATAVSPTATSGTAPLSALATVTDNDPDGLTSNDATVDAGVWLPLAIGDMVWFDLDHDGAQDAAEAPVVGATVSLLTDDGVGGFVPALDANGAPAAAAATDANGRYLFDNLVAGTYRVVFDHGQTGFRWTAADAAGTTDTVDSDALAVTETDATATSVDVVLAVGRPNVRAKTAADDTAFGTPLTAEYLDPTNDAGIWMPVAVGDVVWLDEDYDGVQDDGEEPIEGVTATLLGADGGAARDADGALVAPIVTDATGRYVFDDLLPGTYSIQFSTLPVGHTPTITSAGDDWSVDSDADRAALRTEPFTLTGPRADGSLDPNMTRIADPAVDASLIDSSRDLGLTLIPSIKLKKYVTVEKLSVPFDPADLSTLGCDAQTLPTDGTKPDDCQIADWGGTAMYRMAVTNDGHVPLVIPSIADKVLDAPLECVGLRLISPASSPTVLAVGATIVFQCEVHRIRFNFTNEATATAVPANADGSPIPGAPVVTSKDHAVMDPAELVVGFNLDKKILNNPTPGGFVEWDIDLFNLGPDVAWAPVTVVDDLPPGFTGVSAVAPGWVCESSGPDNRRFVCTTQDNIAVDTSQKVRVRAQLTGPLPAFARNEAYVPQPGVGNPSPNPQNSGSGPNAAGLPAFPAPAAGLTNPYLTFKASGSSEIAPSAESLVRVFDLAQTITYTSDSTGAPNDGRLSPDATVTFTVTTVNQGNTAATAVAPSVYLPSGVTLEDPRWTVADGRATLAAPFSLEAGATSVNTITVRVAKSFSGQVTVWAEVTQATNEFGLPDWDSTVDSVQSNDVFAGDDALGGSGLSGGDEDDHDPASVSVVSPGALPRTGLAVLGLLLAAGLLVALGAVGRAVARRRTGLAA